MEQLFCGAGTIAKQTSFFSTLGRNLPWYCGSLQAVSNHLQSFLRDCFVRHSKIDNNDGIAYDPNLDKSYCEASANDIWARCSHCILWYDGARNSFLWHAGLGRGIDLPFFTSGPSAQLFHALVLDLPGKSRYNCARNVVTTYSMDWKSLVGAAISTSRFKQFCFGCARFISSTICANLCLCGIQQSCDGSILYMVSVPTTALLAFVHVDVCNATSRRGVTIICAGVAGVSVSIGNAGLGGVSLGLGRISFILSSRSQLVSGIASVCEASPNWRFIGQERRVIW
mmetsp:Transcript_20035/g.41890  ORF Transcript_20035/g.41890 Transcript_20035/m.41890 type:complete len:284 (-) Transcript_20035:1578-2429(-)